MSNLKCSKCGVPINDEDPPGECQQCYVTKSKGENMKPVVLISARYEEEQILLKKDDILWQMAKELPEGITVEHTHEWSVKINKEYHRRGGRNSTSIGGPVQALIHILNLIKGE